jgi:parvulin-like peptidyl-prolyl isomerase
LTSVLCGCGYGDSDRADEQQALVATVNGHPISVGDFERYYVDALISTGQNDDRAYRYRQLDNLIDIRLLSEEARRRGFDEDSTYKVFETRLIKKTLADRYFDVAFVERLEPLTDAEIREGFVRYKDRAVVRHLFYKSANAAQKAYDRLTAGRDFLEEARDCYSLAEVDSAAGFLGPIRYFQVDDAFAEAAFDLEVGAVSKPVQSRYGYHIIRLEDRLREPIITESEYQARRNGIESQLKLRKRRLEGDRFVREVMLGLNVEVVPEAIRSLAVAIEELELRVASAPVHITDNVESDRTSPAELRARLRPETVLASYRRDGSDMTFTVVDYSFWLPELPFTEARSRTAASVGRALRNEVFSQSGLEEGLADDHITRRQIEDETARFLAGMLRDRLRAVSSAESLGSDSLVVLAEQLRLARADDESTAQYTQRIETMLGPLVEEVRLIRDLRRKADIRVDTTAFEAIMALGETDQVQVHNPD